MSLTMCQPAVITMLQDMRSVWDLWYMFFHKRSVYTSRTRLQEHQTTALSCVTSAFELTEHKVVGAIVCYGMQVLRATTNVCEESNATQYSRKRVSTKECVFRNGVDVNRKSARISFVMCWMWTTNSPNIFFTRSSKFCGAMRTLLSNKIEVSVQKSTFRHRCLQCAPVLPPTTATC